MKPSHQKLDARRKQLSILSFYTSHATRIAKITLPKTVSMTQRIAEIARRL